MSTPKRGRKEVLTEKLARGICQLIERMPDAGIAVTWANVIAHGKKRFGHGFTRQMLSQKEWNGRKLVAEAFDEAKGVQKRMLKDTTPKYTTSSRAIMQKRIADLEAKILTLREELEVERARKIDALDVVLNTRIDLRRLLDQGHSKCKEQQQ